MSGEFATARSDARKREENDGLNGDEERKTHTKGYLEFFCILQACLARGFERKRRWRSGAELLNAGPGKEKMNGKT